VTAPYQEQYPPNYQPPQYQPHYQPPQQYGYQQPGYQQPQPVGPSCRFCGAFPAVDLTVRAHRGMVIIMQFRRLRGPFCRTCGIATVRSMSADTLVQGWWGYFSMVATPVTLLINLFAHRRIVALPQPSGGMRPPMDPGKSLFDRWQALGFLLPIAVITLLVLAALAG
jgi:hypothetical protein